MTQTPRPMTLGEIVDRTFQIYRSQLGLFAIAALMPALTIFVITLSSSSWFVAHPLYGRMIVFHMTKSSLFWTLGLWIVSGFVHLCFRPAFVAATAAWIGGRRRSLSDCLSILLRLWKPVLAINLCEQVLVILIPGLVIICGALAVDAWMQSLPPRTPAPAATLGILALTVVAGSLYVTAGLFLSLSFQALLAEETSWLGALKRSMQLARAAFGKILALWVSLWLVGFFLSASVRWTLIFLLRSAVVTRTLHGHGGSYLYLVGHGLVMTLYAVLAGPIYPIALTLIYYDQRIRREGYDIEWMMRAAGLNAPEIASAAVRPAVPLSAASVSAEDGPA